MPRSKRNKVVSLTKTKAKGKDEKGKLIESLRDSLDEYEHIYVFTFENMRASIFKDVRMEWKESRIYLGKNSIAQVALGKSTEDEFKDNLSLVSKALEGNVGLLFTNRNKDEVLEYFNGYQQADFAKAGTIPDEDFNLEVGELPFAPTMIDQLRKLGLVVEVDNGKLMLRVPFVVAERGVSLSPEQCKLLVHLDKKLSTFSIQLISHWHDGEFEEFQRTIAE